MPEEKHVLCHCGACKIMSGGEFTLNQIIPKDNFNLTKGNLKTYTYKGDSGTFIHANRHSHCLAGQNRMLTERTGNSVDCFMCPNCGANPYHHQHVMGDKIVIRTGLLKGTENWGKPGAEIFDKQRASWLPQTGENSFPGPPPS